MAVSVYKVQSALSQVTRERTDAYLQSVSAALGDELRLVSIEDFSQAAFGLIYVASGGSEGLFLQEYARLAVRPCYILTSGESNSLAASMEILSYLQQRGQRGEILHGGVEAVALRIRALRAATEAKHALHGTKIGLVGDKSDWLIASSDCDKAYREKLGVTLERVPMEELIAEIKKGGYAPTPWTDKLLTLGYDRAEMEKSLNVYGALKRIVSARGLSAVSVRCFDLLDAVHTTGCLALALLNAEGVYGGCEGDVPSLMSMYILGKVSGEPVFMCNPSRIDSAAGEIVLAHCTLPVDMPDDMYLTTHYESGIGVAIKGHIPEGACTIFKCSAGLDRHFARRAELLCNLDEKVLCRTQIKLRMPDTDYFLTRPINNHHLVCRGDHAAALEAFFALID